MIGLSLPLFLALSPQLIPSSCEAVILDGARKDGRLVLASLALGTGGVRSIPGGVEGSARGQNHRGVFCSPGGVLIRAQVEGVKLDFPNGRELLCTPEGRIHLRSGEKTMPFLRGLRLILADGAVVTIRRSGSARLPLSSVEVEVGEHSQRLWAGNRRVVNASRTGAFLGTTVLILGDGTTLYSAHVSGPLIALSRVVVPKTESHKSPRRRLVVLGDVLAESMRLLPAHAPRKSVQFPQVREAAMRFAHMGDLFAGRIPRPPGALGELWFPLSEEYRLKVESTQDGVLTVGLYGAKAGVPGVEWTISGHTQIHFVRPTGGTSGGPRYFMRGIDLDEMVAETLPVQRHRGQRIAVQELIRALGGRRPKPLEVKRR